MEKSERIAVAYVRYSSQSHQTEQSIDGQLRVINDYANREGYTIQHVYADRGISGRREDRPEFQAMVDDAQKKTFQYILVYKLDRFSRDRTHSAVYKKLLHQLGVSVISATEGAFGDTSESVILEAMLEALAEFYSRQLSQNVRRGMKETAIKGNNTGGATPFGYRIENKKLVIDEGSADIVRFVFTKYADGSSMHDILADLNDRGFFFGTNSFRYMLRNPKYIGKVNYEGIEYNCPAIIAPDVFARVQERIKINQYHGGRNKAKICYELSGKCVCGLCGAPMVGEYARSKTGQVYYYYVCANRKKKAGTCTKSREPKEPLEKLVAHYTIDFVLSPERIPELAQKIFDNQESSGAIAQIRLLTAKITKINANMDRMFVLMMDDSVTAIVDRARNQIKYLESKKIELEKKIQQLKANQPLVQTKETIAELLYRQIPQKKADPEYCSSVLNSFVKNITLTEDHITLKYTLSDTIQKKSGQQNSSYSARNGSPIRPTDFQNLSVFFLYQIVIMHCYDPCLTDRYTEQSQDRKN